MAVHRLFNKNSFMGTRLCIAFGFGGLKKHITEISYFKDSCFRFRVAWALSEQAVEG